MRTCVGCRRAAPVGELVRVTRRPDGSLTGERSAPGRGAWLCSGSAACWDRAVRRRAFDRAFRAPVADGAIERLGTELGLGRPQRGGAGADDARNRASGA